MSRCLIYQSSRTISHYANTTALPKVLENSDTKIYDNITLMKQNEKQSLKKQRSNTGPSFKATYQTEMSKLKSPSDIQNYLNKSHSFKVIPKDKMYIEAIICYGKMHAYDMGYALFEQSKQDSNIKKDTYAAIMWLMLKQNKSVNTINKCLDLLDEMKQTFNWQPSVNCYQVLLSNMTTLKLWSHGMELINNIFKHNKEILKKSFVIRSSIANFYSKTYNYEKAVEFINKLKLEYGNDILKDSDYMFSSILSGVAAVITMQSDRKEYHVQVAEKLFQICWTVNNRPPIREVFASMIDVYANAGDIESCLDMLESMRVNVNYPNADIIVVTPVLKALHERMGYEYVWNVVNDLKDIIEVSGIQKDTIFYTNLFSLCGKIRCDYTEDDLIGKLKGFYDDMVKLDKLVPTQYTLGSLLMNGLSVFGYNLEHCERDDVKDKMKHEMEVFVDWVLFECKKYNLPLNAKMKQTLDAKMKYLMSLN